MKLAKYNNWRYRNDFYQLLYEFLVKYIQLYSFPLILQIFLKKLVLKMTSNFFSNIIP